MVIYVGQLDYEIDLFCNYFRVFDITHRFTSGINLNSVTYVSVHPTAYNILPNGEIHQAELLLVILEAERSVGQPMSCCESHFFFYIYL